VKSTKEIQFGHGPHVGHCEFHLVVIEFGAADSQVNPNRDSFYEVPQLGKKVLREKCSIVTKYGDIPAYRLIRAAQLVVYRTHHFSLTEIVVVYAEWPRRRSPTCAGELQHDRL